MTKGEVEYAERQALNQFDEWIDSTGALSRGSGWYYEAQSIVKDAVNVGIMSALKISFRFEDGELMREEIKHD